MAQGSEKERERKKGKKKKKKKKKTLTFQWRPANDYPSHFFLLVSQILLLFFSLSHRKDHLNEIILILLPLSLYCETDFHECQ